jgi:hypothetical protein
MGISVIKWQSWWAFLKEMTKLCVFVIKWNFSGHFEILYPKRIHISLAIDMITQ